MRLIAHTAEKREQDRLIAAGLTGLLFQFGNLFMVPGYFDITWVYSSLAVFAFGLGIAFLAGRKFRLYDVPPRAGTKAALFSPPVAVFNYRNTGFALNRFYELHAETSHGTLTMPKPFAIHPGEILLTEFLQPLGLTVYRLAKEIAIPAPRVNDIVRGKRSISADSALRLGVFFNLPAQFWLNLQNDYDLRLASTVPLANIKPYQAA